MANEISVSLGLYVSKGGMQSQRSESKSITMTGNAITHEIQALTTTEAVLVEGADLGTPGWVFVKNLDTAIDVYIGKVKISSNGDAMCITLSPGESCLFRAKTAIYAMSASGTPSVEYIIVED